MIQYFNYISATDQAVMDRSLLKLLVDKSEYDCLLIFDKSGTVVAHVNANETLGWKNIVGVSLKQLLEDPDFYDEHQREKFTQIDRKDDSVHHKKQVRIKTENNELVNVLCSYGVLRGLPSYLDGCKAVLIKLKEETPCQKKKTA